MLAFSVAWSSSLLHFLQLSVVVRGAHLVWVHQQPLAEMLSVIVIGAAQHKWLGQKYRAPSRRWMTKSMEHAISKLLIKR